MTYIMLPPIQKLVEILDRNNPTLLQTVGCCAVNHTNGTCIGSFLYRTIIILLLSYYLTSALLSLLLLLIVAVIIAAVIINDNIITSIIVIDSHVDHCYYCHYKTSVLKYNSNFSPLTPTGQADGRPL